MSKPLPAPYPPPERERRDLIERSFERDPCKRCRYMLDAGIADTMSTMRCEDCQSSLRQRWQMERLYARLARISGALGARLH